MRFFRNSWIGIGLAILFGASLFFFRGQARYSNLFNSDNFVADISGTPISTTKFMRSMDMNINQFSQMIGSKLTGDQVRSFQVHQIALQNLTLLLRLLANEKKLFAQLELFLNVAYQQ